MAGADSQTRHGYSTCMKPCQYCNTLVNSKGIGSHERACQKRNENAKAINSESARDLARAIAVARFAKLRKTMAASKPQPLAVNDMNQSAGRDDTPMDVDDFGERASTGAQNDNPVPAADNMPVDSRTGNTIVEPIKIEYHPHSGRATEILPFHEYRQKTADEPKPPADKDPWMPFNTLADYEYAEIALAAGLSAKQNNSLLALINRIALGEVKLTLRSNTDLENSWERASHKLAGFEREKFRVPYKNESREFEVHFRPIWDWAQNILSDSRLISHMVWDAKKLYQYDESTHSYIRFFDEPWTGNRFWDVQSAIPKDGKPLCFIFYADKNKLSSFGTQKGYPVVMRCANLPVSIRNGEGLGGGIVVGWLPIVPESANDNGKTSFANFKNTVWHRAVEIILRSIKNHSRTGCWVKCADGEARRLFPCILIISADYEESCYIALTRGSKCLKPCPVCCVPKEGLNNLAIDYMLRTAAESRLHYNAALLKTTMKEKHESLKPHGLRLIPNAFWDLNNSDVHRAISWDRLHAYHSGLFANHLLPVFKALAKAQGRPLEAKVDKRIKEFPVWRNLYHFDNVMNITFNDGKKHEDMSKQLFFVIHDFFDRKDHVIGYIFLRLFRCFLVLDVYLSLDMHTSKTIELGRKEFAKFGHLLNSFVDADEGSPKNWKFMKAHSHKHAFDDIEAKGVTRNYNTKPNEKLHGPLRDIYHGRTNFRDVAPQILKINHQLLVSALIRSQINALAETNDDEENEEEDESQIICRPKKKSFILPPHDKYHLGANQPPCTLSQLAAQHRSDVAFNDFKRRLTEFLNNLFRTYDIPQPGNKYITLHPDHMITEFRFLKLNYESLVTRHVETDFLRCSPKFFRKPRYDFVIVDTVRGNIFARLLFMFAIWIDENPYRIALVQPFDAYIGPTRRTDEDLGLFRVGMKPRARSEFISVLTIIRGAMIVPTFEAGRENEYLVMDIIDSDMFFRVQQMRQIQNQ